MDEAVLNFEDEALEEIAAIAEKKGTGARGLKAIFERIMLDYMYDLPAMRGKTLTLTKEMVLEKQEPEHEGQ